jgi:hypothetical protein
MPVLAATLSLLLMGQMSGLVVRVLGARIAAGLLFSLSAVFFPVFGGFTWQTAFLAAVELSLFAGALTVRHHLPTLWRPCARTAKSLVAVATWLLAAGLGVCAFLIFDLTGSIGYAATFGATGMAFAMAGTSMLFAGDRGMEHRAWAGLKAVRA